MADNGQQINFQYLDSSILPNDWPYPLKQYFLQLPQVINATHDRANDAESNASQQTKDIQAINESLASLTIDSVSKSVAGNQSLNSALSVSARYLVNGVQVVGERQTGWSASNGSAKKGGLDADATYLASPTYQQSDLQVVIDALIEARQVIKALQDALKTHGLIDGN